MASPREFNVIAIGAGATGLVTTAATAGLGGRAALIERGKLGGDCLNYGCVPSKALIASARLAQRMRDATHWGLAPHAPAIDLPAVFASMRARRAHIEPNDSQERFESLGVTVHRGAAQFRSPHEVEVNGAILRGRFIVIATGGRPVRPKIAGLEDVRAFTNETIFDELDYTPRSIAIIGGGPIGCELGQTFQRLGVQVTLCQSHDQLLPREDPDVAAAVRTRFEAEGMQVRLHTRVVRVRREGASGVRLVFEDGTEITAEALLLAAGRKPNLENLGLEAAGVRVNERGVIVNDHLQSSQPHIFAGGDVAGGPQFTHLADHHARVIVENIIRSMVPPLRWIGALAKVNHRVLTACTYTTPEIARVGLTEREARAAGRDVEIVRVELAHVDRYILERETEGFVKVIADRKRGEILGATIVGEGAGDLIHELALAMQHRIPLGKIASVIHAYPTRAEAVRRAADAFNRTRFTPGKKKFLAGLFRRNLP